MTGRPPETRVKTLAGDNRRRAEGRRKGRRGETETQGDPEEGEFIILTGRQTNLSLLDMASICFTLPRPPSSAPFLLPPSFHVHFNLSPPLPATSFLSPSPLLLIFLLSHLHVSPLPPLFLLPPSLPPPPPLSRL